MDSRLRPPCTDEIFSVPGTPHPCGISKSLLVMMSSISRPLAKLGFRV